MRRPSSLPPDEADGGAERPVAGLWRIDGNDLACVERFDVGPAIVLVPGEDVLLLAVDLPIAQARRRIEALPFAVEDRVAAPLETLHMALGASLGGERHLAGIVARERMERWVDLLARAGLDRAALVPDSLAPPAPPPGAWSVDIAAGRALVRADDATGFALPAAHLAAAWAAAGRPRAIAYGESPPPEIGAEAGIDDAGGLAARLGPPALDLRQGPYARPRRAVSALWRRIAIVAVAGAAAHAAIAAADTLALGHIASTREAETRALVEAAAPGVAIGDDLASGVARLVPAGGPGPSAFLPLFGRIAGAMRPLGPDLRLREVAFDGAAGTMSIEIEAPTLAALQRIGPALSAAGLSARAGAASQGEGKAIGAWLIRSGA